MIIFSYGIAVGEFSFELQQELIADRCSQLGLSVDMELWDEPLAVCEPLLKRWSGQCLRFAGKGDIVLVCGEVMLLPTVRQAVAALRRLQKAGVTIHETDACIEEAESLLSEEYLSHLEEVMRRPTRRGKAVSLGMQRLRADGRRRSGSPPIGCRFERRGGVEIEVPDEAELEVIEQVVRLRDEGWSWRQIVNHLNERQFVTASGKPWYEARVRRAYDLAKSGQLPTCGGSGLKDEGRPRGHTESRLSAGGVPTASGTPWPSGRLRKAHALAKRSRLPTCVSGGAAPPTA